MRSLGAVALATALAAAAAGALEVPGTGGRLEAEGWVDGLAVAPVGGERQRPGTLTELRLRGTAAPWLRGHLAVRGAVGGPYEDAHAGIMSLVHTFQNHSPSAELSEAYAELSFARADVLAGIQKAAWGRLDGLPPTDVVVPRDYHDPLVRDFEEAKIGIPLLQGTYHLGDVRRLGLSGLRLTALWTPLATASRLPLLEERWFPQSLLIRSVALPRRQIERILGDLLGTPVELAGDLTVPVETRTLNHRPPTGLDESGVGGRLGGSVAGVDWNAYHYTGPETGPDLDLAAQLRLVDLRVSPDGALDPQLRGLAVLRQATDRMHMTGADGAFTIGNFALRGEVAVFQDRPFLRLAQELTTPAAIRQLPLRRITRQLQERGVAMVPLGDLFLDLDALEWGLGADYPIGGWTPILQVQQLVLLEEAPRLLVSDPETRFLAVLRHSLLSDRLEIEVRGLYALSRGGWFLMPRVAYRLRDDVMLRVGYLAIGGSRNSYVGQFQDNDEFIFQARYSF